MKIGHKIILSSVAAGIFLWILDAAIDFYVFSSGLSFMDSLIFEVSLHECYFRIFTIVSLIIFGVIVSKVVSGKEKLEKQFVQANDDWQETFDSITDMITIHDNNYNILRANRAASNNLDISFVNGTGKTKCYECFHGKSSAPGECPSCESLKTGLPVVSEMFEPHLNKFIEIRTMPRIGRNRKMTGLIHVVRDVTEKRELQKFVSESEERFRALFNQASDAIFLLDPFHEIGPVIVDANNVACRMHGYTWNELIGQPVSLIYDTEDRMHLNETIHEVMNKQYISCELKHVRKDRTTFPVETSAQAINITGRSYILSIDRDITERKQIEDELKRHREQLMSLVEERTYELKQTNEKLLREIDERKRAEAEVVRASHLAALGELAAGVAHEINNPINGIINYSQILANKSSAEGMNYDIAVRIIRESERIAVIVKNLLSFARDSKEEKQPVNLRDVMFDSLALTEAHLKKDGIQLRINIPSNLPPVFAQPQQIEQVFLNVISNARYSLNRKYNGIHENKLLDITGETVNNNGRLYVRTIFHDTGTGIAAGILDKVINPFFTTKPSNEGTGLGLSVSHGIISSHGGKINIESVEGDYAKIIIDLPVRDNGNFSNNR